MAGEKITKEDIANAKEWKATVDLANNAIADGNSLNQAFGKLLKENMKSSGAINDNIRSASNILKSQLDSQKKGVSFQDKIKSIVKQKAELDEKITKYDKMNHNVLVDKYTTQNKFLSAKGQETIVNELQLKTQEKLLSVAKKVRNTLTLAGIFATTVAIAKKFAQELDAVGKQFGSLVNLGPNLTNDLLDSGVEARKLGQGVAETSSITSDLASNFGVSLDNAAGLSNKILDTAMATGLSNDEATKLFGTLGQVLGLSQQQSEALIEGTAQLARQAGVAPQQVLKDIAASSETIATFTKAGGENLFEAAVAARQFGLNIDSVAKAARSTLDFESSINAEVEASILLGQNVNLQRARQLALSKDLVGFQQEIKNQLGGINDFTKLNVFQQESLAKAVGMSVGEVSKLVSGTEKLSLAGALSGESFEDLLGEDGLSNLTKIINAFKSVGAELVKGLGPSIEKILKNLTEFFKNSGGFESIAAAIQLVVKGTQMFIQNLPLLIGLMVTAKGISLSLAAAQAALAVSKGAAATALVGGLGAAVIAGIIATSVAGVINNIPKAQTGISGFSGGPIMVGESGPEIMNVPRGTSVMSAEPTRQILNGGSNEKVEGTLSRIENALLAANDQRGNMKLTAGRGTLNVALDESLGGGSLTMG